MDINDSYRLPDATVATPLGTPKASATILEDAMDEEIERQTCETDPHLRELITITSIFVTFKEGWSPSYKYDDKDHSCKLNPNSPTKPLAGPITSPPGSPALSPKFLPLEKRGSVKSISSGIIRRTSLLSKSNRNSIVSDSEDDHQTSPSRSNSIAKTGRARADSSSTVLVHRAASNRRKNNQQWRPELLGAQTTLQENSKEDLGRMSGSKSRSLKSPSPLAGVETNGTPAGGRSRHSSVEKKEEEYRQSVTTMGSGHGGLNGTARGKKGKKGKHSLRIRRLFCVSGDAS